MNNIKIKLLLLFSCVVTKTTHEALQENISWARELISQEQYNKATSYLHTLIPSCAPNNPSDIFTLGALLTESGDLSTALDLFKRVSALLPGHTVPLYNIAYVLKLLGNIDAALAVYNNILEIDPHHEAAHLGQALTYLQKGDFINGWNAHTFNLQKQGKYAPELRQLLANNNLEGKKILLIPEGGMGDTLQFIRYAKQLYDMGAYVMVSPQNPLIPLLSLCPYIDHIIPLQGPRPIVDAQVTLMSLPATLHAMPETFAQNVPYLQADTALVEQWQLKIGADHNFKVGLCWQCDLHNDSSRLPLARRGIPLQALTTLAAIDNIGWYSLQKKDGIEQIQPLSNDMHIITFDSFDDEHGAFMDSAALIEALDLVITIDSAIAHLAGALGKQVWLLLPYSTDWRWIHGLSTSPWYPTMTIFKQATPFDWKGVMSQVKEKLQQTIACRSQAHTINAEVSIGEFLDKISILNIKNKRIKDQKKLKNVRTELATLNKIKEKQIPHSSMLDVLEQNLFEVNSKLWDIEDKIRDKEYTQQFDDEFIHLARSVYMTNDERMAIKQQLNQFCGSRLVEEKSYYDYLKK